MESRVWVKCATANCAKHDHWGFSWNVSSELLWNQSERSKASWFCKTCTDARRDFFWPIQLARGLNLWRYQYVRKGSQPPIQPSLRTILRWRLLISHKILYCPFNLLKQLKTTSILSSVANYKKEDNTIVLKDDVYYCLLVEPLDNGCTGTLKVPMK